MNGKATRAMVLGALVAGVSVGCSALDDGGDTCALDDTCEISTVEPPPEETAWGCLTLPPPAVNQPSAMPVVYAVPVVEWSVRTPLTGRGLTATLCGIAQAQCDSPLAQPYTVEPASVGGMPVPIPMPLAPVPLPEGFDGFIKFQVTDEVPSPETAFLPLAYYLGGPVIGQVTATDLALLMIRRNLLNTVIQQSFERTGLDGDMEATVDTVMRGIVVLRAIDCLGEPAPDVRFTINREGVIPFQLPRSRLPLSGQPPYTEPIYTDELGTAGFVNVLPGNVRVEAYRRDDTVPFGTYDIGVLEGQISLTVLRPAYFNTAALERDMPEAATP